MRYNILVMKGCTQIEREDMFMAFLAKFLEYVIIMIILAGVAVVGVFTGKKLRDNKDAKNKES